ncbi:hypothetical protein D3C81_2190760 [compost metagenome]
MNEIKTNLEEVGLFFVTHQNAQKEKVVTIERRRLDIKGLEKDNSSIDTICDP